MSIYTTTYLNGDFKYYRFYDHNELSTILVYVLFSYIVICGLTFNILYKATKYDYYISKKSSFFANQIISTRTGKILLTLQLIYLIYCLLEGTGTAGIFYKSDNPLKYFFSLFNVDYIFLAYYCVHRKNRLFKYNLIVYVLSNLVRGWAGIWLFLGFLELSFLYREGKISIRRIVFITAALLSFTPFIFELKNAIRLWASEKSGTAMLSGISEYIYLEKTSNLSQIFINSYNKIIMRLEQLSSVIVVYDNSDIIKDNILNSNVSGMFSEGWLQGLILRRYNLATPDIHSYLARRFTPLYELTVIPESIVSNTHIGLVGWIFIDPLQSIFYFFYIISLILLSLLIARHLDKTGSLSDLIWLACLVFIMNGWMAAYQDVIIGCINLIFISFIAKKSLLRSQVSREPIIY